jgi:hypothetical protein
MLVDWLASFMQFNTKVEMWIFDNMIDERVDNIGDTGVTVSNWVWRCSLDEDTESFQAFPDGEEATVVGFVDATRNSPKTVEKRRKELALESLSPETMALMHMAELQPTAEEPKTEAEILYVEDAERKRRLKADAEEERRIRNEERDAKCRARDREEKEAYLRQRALEKELNGKTRREERRRVGKKM